MVGAILMAGNVSVAARYRLCRSISGQSGKRLFREITAGTEVFNKLEALLYIRGIVDVQIIGFRGHALQSISRSQETSQGVVHSTHRQRYGKTMLVEGIKWIIEQNTNSDLVLSLGRRNIWSSREVPRVLPQCSTGQYRVKGLTLFHTTWAYVPKTETKGVCL
jgi:hypothetical protein